VSLVTRTYFRLHKELREVKEYVANNFSHLTAIADASTVQPNWSRLSNSTSNARKRSRMALDDIQKDTKDAKVQPNTTYASKRTRTTPSRMQEGQRVTEKILTSPCTPSQITLPVKGTRIIPEVTVS